jgi:nucleotide-binding universal stress UspA family protein
MGSQPDYGNGRSQPISRKRLKEEPMVGSIICGTDDSESARRAARVARDLGSKLGFRLVFVHVLETGSPHEKIRAVAERLHHLTEGCTEVDCGASWLVDVGHPVDRLIAAAVDEEASLIVVGSQGTGSSLLGSISADISRRAPCPVVVVPPGADAHLPAGNGHVEFGERVRSETPRSPA